MKFSILALALGAVSASALTTVTAPCGTSCPTTIPDKMITRSAAPVETSPCPSLIVSSIGAQNTTNPMMAGMPAPGSSSSSSGSGSGSGSSESFKGAAADRLAGGVGAVLCAGVLAVLAL